MTNLYEILQVNPSASSTEIEEAYKRLKIEANASGENNTDYDFAHSILTDTSKRQAYDLGINTHQPSTQTISHQTPSWTGSKKIPDERFMEPWELAQSGGYKASPLKETDSFHESRVRWKWGTFVKWGLVAGVTIVLLALYTHFLKSAHKSRSSLFEQSLVQRTDLRLIPGFNDAMCEMLNAAGPEGSCEKITGVLNNLAKEIVVVLPNQEKGFTFQINCMTTVDRADGIKKCQEGVLLTLFNDDSMTVLHFRNSDLDYLTGLSKLVFVEHPMIGFTYVGKGAHSENVDLPEFAVETIYGFDKEYASGTHRDVLRQARGDREAEIYTVSKPSFVRFHEE